MNLGDSPYPFDGRFSAKRLMTWTTKKKPRETRGFFCLVHHCDVGRLRSLGTLFDSEFDLLSFLQVTEPIALNGGEMDENVLSALALDKAEAFVTIEPLDGTSYTI